MKKSFPGYFQPTEAELNLLWEKCIFVFDANILHNLYRYSDETRTEYLKILENMKERLWLPHRAAEEYFDNRIDVIAKQGKSYEDTITKIKEIQSDLQNNRKHPFVSKETLKKSEKIFSKIIRELLDSKESHAERVANDTIKDAICNLFDGKVGVPYSESELEAICKDGEDRYQNKIPHGYMDCAKKESGKPASRDFKKYGDLIIWKQIIDKAKTENRGVVFITDDKKEDWWTLFEGKKICIRPELIKEFRDQTENDFYMYQSDRFVDFASKYFQQTVTPEMVDEIRDIRQQQIWQDANSLEFARTSLENIITNDRISSLEKQSLELQSLIHEKIIKIEELARVGQDCLGNKESLCTDDAYLHTEKMEMSNLLRQELNRLFSMKAAIEREIEQYRRLAETKYNEMMTISSGGPISGNVKPRSWVRRERTTKPPSEDS